MNTTTKNALQANGGVGLVVYLALTIVRSFFTVPWGTEVDIAIAGMVGASIGPWVARKIAFVRDPSKPERTAMLDTLEHALTTADPDALAAAVTSAANRIKIMTKLEPQPERDPEVRAEKWRILKRDMQAAIDAKNSVVDK